MVQQLQVSCCRVHSLVPEQTLIIYHLSFMPSSRWEIEPSAELTCNTNIPIDTIATVSRKSTIHAIHSIPSIQVYKSYKSYKSHKSYKPYKPIGEACRQLRQSMTSLPPQTATFVMPSSRCGGNADGMISLPESTKSKGEGDKERSTSEERKRGRWPVESMEDRTQNGLPC